MMKTTYCGDGWEFEIEQEEINQIKSVNLSLRGDCDSVKRWELEELAEFIKKYLADNVICIP